MGTLEDTIGVEKTNKEKREEKKTNYACGGRTGTLDKVNNLQ